MLETIIKRSGQVEAFDADKLNELGEWAVEGTDCSWPLLVTQAVKKLHGGCNTKQLMKAMIDTAADMIEENYDWQYVASKLTVADIRKDVFASFAPPSLKEFYKEMVSLGRWEEMDYTDQELDQLEEVLDHDKDENFTYAGIKQVLNKYLIKDLKTGQLYETPQFMYMGLSMAMFQSTEDPILRYNEVKDYYKQASDWVVNIPTPILLGLRTPNKGFASCCLIEGGDTLDSIDASEHAVFKMVANRAGIGYHLQSRSVGDEVRNGEVIHAGKLPYYRHVDRSTKANVQAGRGGAATVHFVIFDPEIETLLKLKSDKVSEEVKIKHMDYSMVYNKYFIKRMANKQDITLLSYKDAPEVHKAFYDKDMSKFVELYELAELRYPQNIKIKASTIFATMQQQALETGRIYGVDIEEVNRRSTFKDPIKMSNLCVAGDTEILTDKGYFPIIDLVGQPVNVWNGEEFSETTVMKTGEDQTLYTVGVAYKSLASGSVWAAMPTSVLVCTEYHKWYLEDGTEVRTSDLSLGDKLLGWTSPEGDVVEHLVITPPVLNRDKGDTYCFTEPKRGMGVFNGILTGNCQEIIQPTNPYWHVTDMYDKEVHYDEDGNISEISLCTLAAHNVDLTAEMADEQLERVCYLTVKGLDNIVDMQNYPFPNMEMTSKNRRNLGIGYTNLAGALANRFMLFSSEQARTWTHQQVERLSYFVHKASMKLAMERGACEWFDRTTYSEGQLPIHSYRQEVDKVHKAELKYDWNTLARDIKNWGLRNSVLEAVMPSESSSIACGTSNGVESVRKLVISKKTEQGVVKFVAPYAKTKGFSYETSYNIPVRDHLAMMAVLQKFVGQTISTNRYYNYNSYPDKKIPIQDLLQDFVYGAKLGLKSWYYLNSSEEEMDSACGDGGCTL